MTTAGLDAADLAASSPAPAWARRTTAGAHRGDVHAEQLRRFRVDGSAAIINHPQVAMLGLGRIIDRPWVVDGEIVVAQDHADVASSSTTGSATAGPRRAHALRRRRHRDPAAAIVRL